MSMSLTIDRVLRASPEKLYEVWTSEQYLSQWFGVKVDAEAKIGGTIRFHFGEEGGPIQGKYLALEPYKRIVFTWTQGGDKLNLDTQVQVTFNKEANGTRLTLRHEGFLNQKSFDAHDEGWLAYMELWDLRSNSGPEEAMRASIAETFPSSCDVASALPRLLEKPISQFTASELNGGGKVIQGENFEARLTPCRFGTCVALTEWGFTTEEQKLSARTKMMERFAALKKES